MVRRFPKQRYGYNKRAIAADFVAFVLAVASGLFLALYITGYLKP